MSISVRKWLTDVVTVASVQASSQYHDPTFGEQREVRCRIQTVRTTITRPDGSEVDSGHTLLTDERLELSDHVWLPGSDVTKADAAKTPVSVESSHDRYGRGTLYKVLL